MRSPVTRPIAQLYVIWYSIGITAYWYAFAGTQKTYKQKLGKPLILCFGALLISPNHIISWLLRKFIM